MGILEYVHVFPAMAAANTIPTHEQLPRMHWRSMAADWGTDAAEELEALRARFGAEPARLRTETVRNVPAGLSRQKAAEGCRLAWDYVGALADEAL